MSLPLENALLALLFAAITAFAVVGLVRRSRTILLVAVTVAAALIAATLDIPGDMPRSLKTATRWGVIAVASALIWVALVQEPVWLARRLGFIHRSREWEYDVFLAGLVDEFNEKIAVARGVDQAARHRGHQPAEAERAVVQSEARRILDRLRSAAPPSNGWADLMNEYLQLLELHMEYLGSPISEELEHRFQDLNATATIHREQLRSSFRAKARSQFRWP